MFCIENLIIIFEETEDGFVLVPTSSSLTLTGDTADHRGVHELESSSPAPANYPLLGLNLKFFNKKIMNLLVFFLLQAQKLLVELMSCI